MAILLLNSSVSTCSASSDLVVIEPFGDFAYLLLADTFGTTFHWKFVLNCVKICLKRHKYYLVVQY